MILVLYNFLSFFFLFCSQELKSKTKLLVTQEKKKQLRRILEIFLFPLLTKRIKPTFAIQSITQYAPTNNAMHKILIASK